MLAKVRRVHSEIDSTLCPKIVQFENGCINNCSEVAKKIKFEIQKPKFKEDAVKKDDILVADTGNMKYFGHREDLPCRYYLGVLDSDTGDLDIYNTEMYSMLPTIIEDNNKIIVQDQTDSDATFLERNDKLVEAFGSARQKRAVSARQKNVVDKLEISNQILEVAERIDLTKKSPEDDGSSLSITPPINLNAPSPALLYDIEHIISPNDEAVLMENVDEFLTASSEKIRRWRDESRYPEYVLDHLTSLPVSEEARLEKAAMLRYLAYMMQFFKLTVADLRRRGTIPNMPSHIRERLFAEFSLEKDRKRFLPKRFKDKLLCYILVLALIIDEFVLDCSSLMRDLKLGPGRISSPLKAIGCYVETKRVKTESTQTDSGKKSNAITIATLRLPLPIHFMESKKGTS